MPHRLEMHAGDFVVGLAFGAENQSRSLLRRYPGLVNTLAVMDAAVPQIGPVGTYSETFALPLQVRKIVAEEAEQKSISKKQLYQVMNARSPKHGETIATLIIKLMILQAKFIAEARASHTRSPHSMTALYQLRKILNGLINEEGMGRLDWNVANAHGQYPLQLLESVAKDPNVFRLLSNDHRHVAALTGSTVKNKIAKNKGSMPLISIIDNTNLPKLRVKLTTATWSEIQSISMVETDRPTYWQSDLKSVESVAPIRPAGCYVVTYFPNKKVADIVPIQNMYKTQVSVNYNGKWIKIEPDCLYSVFKKLLSLPTKKKNLQRIDCAS